jgi:FkbM family methyltransferase
MSTIPEGIEELPNGQWVVAGDTHLGLWAKQKGNIVTDPHVFEFLRPFLKGTDGWVFDIGANIGDHTRAYLDMGLPVLAIEPHPLSFQCLQHNCPDARTLNIAVSDEEGELRFMGLDNVGASRVRQDGEMVVQASPLRLSDVPLPSFIKIDCEGWEPKVLNGIREILKLWRPMVYIEINAGALADNGFSAQDIHQVFEELGYREHRFYPAQATPDWPQYDLLFLP